MAAPEQPDASQWRALPGRDRVSEAWPQITDRLLRRWRKLTVDDVLYPYGSARYLARVLQDRYGIDRQEVLLQVHEFECGL